MERHRNECEAVEQRFRRLQKSQRCWRTATLAAVALICALTILGATAKQPTTDLVRTRAIEVVDDKGVVRVSATTGENGSAAISLIDPEARVRASLATLADGSSLLGLYDATQHLRAGVTQMSEGYTALVFYDSEGRGLANIGQGADGNVHVTLFDRRARPRFVVALTPEDDAGAVLLDAAGKVLWGVPKK